MKYCILYEVCMIKIAPHSTLSPQMWCIKKNKRLVCTHPDLLARICKLVDRKKFGLICFPRLIYSDQEPLLHYYTFLSVHVRLYQLDTRFVSLQNHLTFQQELRFQPWLNLYIRLFQLNEGTFQKCSRMCTPRLSWRLPAVRLGYVTEMY